MVCFLHKMVVFIQFFCIFCISAFTGAENGCDNTFPLLAQCILALNADFSVWHSCIFKLKAAFQMNFKCCFAGSQACINHIIHLCEIHCILYNGAIAYALIFGLFCGPIHLYRKCASYCVIRNMLRKVNLLYIVYMLRR